MALSRALSIMEVNCTPEIESLIAEHHQMLAAAKHVEAKTLLQDALTEAYEQSPVSFDITALLDALALGCKEKEQFQEASVYLAQSLAIKKLLLGERHPEIVTAMRRLGFCLDPDRARVIRAKTKQLAKDLGLKDEVLVEDFSCAPDQLNQLEKLLGRLDSSP